MTIFGLSIQCSMWSVILDENSSPSVLHSSLYMLVTICLDSCFLMVWDWIISVLLYSYWNNDGSAICSWVPVVKFHISLWHSFHRHRNIQWCFYIRIWVVISVLHLIYIYDTLWMTMTYHIYSPPPLIYHNNFRGTSEALWLYMCVMLRNVPLYHTAAFFYLLRHI